MQVAPRELQDGCARRIDHLRVSVTPRCDLHCAYCRPVGEGVNACSIASLDDHARLQFIQFMHDHYGLAQVRLTGGEPLVHAGIVEFVAAIRRAMPGLSLAMTTNGQRLAEFAADLRSAGLDRLNISLDALSPTTYRRITGGDVRRVLAGIESARLAGFPPPRVNVVVLRGMNEAEMPSLVHWGLKEQIEVRFLEAMPIGQVAATNARAFVSAKEIRRVLQSEFRLLPLAEAPEGTARRYEVVGGAVRGHLGIIAPLTEPFCAGCRRVRLTSDGRFFPCLLDSNCASLCDGWSKGDLDPTWMARHVELSVARKRAEGPQRQSASMVALGG
jgi:cyclic pyranopterin phosphate synthase